MTHAPQITGSAIPTDARQCAVCGADNQCAIAANPGATDCWCRAQQFPETLRAVVSSEQCICACCAENALLQS
ncbi:cysteine-rich CWC family protein [Simiduia aestuariiviva]|uniref:cysteine-rich CWC family protein n=1 Tax=Simiduia aestuariiviva TaxID=1510459 RepID=UPI001613D997